ncbi:Chemotaxis protein methyltransferase [Thalassocella blandensis]|nr:Chemotaxis protein methyltransferase [Thalassocella blandensis]
MPTTNLEMVDVESKLLIDAIYLRYGYDFRDYQTTTMINQFKNFVASRDYNNIAELIPRVLHSREVFYELLMNITINVTEMFRGPEFYHSLRDKVIPHLKTYPYLNVWHAGCSTGEEPYSMSIFLKEEELLKRSQIYATDINDLALKKARTGIYDIRRMQDYSKKYHLAGGQGSLSDYYHTRYGGAKILDEFRERIVFSKHNLVSDSVFAEMQLIVCKNVLIYFSRSLRDNVLALLTDSLCPKGFLCLGEHESLDYTPVRAMYDVVDESKKIYRKRIQIR